MSVRDLLRSFAIWHWEIEQAAEFGWLRIVTRRPSGRGRPFRVAELCDGRNAKLPIPRRQIEPAISVRHCLFAMRAVKKCCPRGMRAFGFNIPGIVTAYIETYQPRSYAGARASASRLERHPHVKAAMRWFYASVSNEIPHGETMPKTARGVWSRLRELGNGRAR